MRTDAPRRALRPIAAAASAILLGACNLIFGVGPGTLGTGGEGGASSSSSSTSTSSSSSSSSSASSSSGALPDAGDDAGAVSLEGCVLLLHLDEQSFSGAGAVKDSSGQGNHATAVGTAAPTPDGKIGGAAVFDGSGYLKIPSSASLQSSAALTYAAWVYPQGLVGGAGDYAPGVLSKRLAFQSNVAFTLFFWDQDHAFADIQDVRIPTNAAFANDTWAHIAVVYDAAADPSERVRIYVNGLLDTTATADPALAQNDEELRVGDLPGGGYLFTGKIDEVAIWTRALGPDEVLALSQGKGFF